MTCPSLRQLRDAGTRPADVATVEDLQRLAESTTIFDKSVGPHPFPLDEHRDWLLAYLENDDIDEDLRESERLRINWEIEIADDPAIRTWFFDQLPADIRAEAIMAQDEEDRPFPLEPATGPYHCSSCGGDGDGDHVEVVIRYIAVSATGIDIRYCLPCVRTVTKAPG